MSKQELVFNVKADVKGAVKDIEKVEKAVDKAADSTEKLQEGTEKGTKGFRGMGKVIKGVGTALKAAGIGLIAGVLAKFMEVVGSNQTVMDKFKTGMEFLSIAFNDFFRFLNKNVGTVVDYFKAIFSDPRQALIDFGEIIKKSIIERFESMLETFGHLGKALGELVKGNFKEAWESAKSAGKESVDIWTGVDNSVDKLSDTFKTATGAISEYTRRTWESAEALVELDKASRMAVVANQGLIEQYDKQAEGLRQVRDDVRKTFAERIKANEDLGEVLEKQHELMKENANIVLASAQAQFEKNGNDENAIALMEAKNELAAIDAQITGFKSEQLTNEASLQQELLDIQNMVAEESLSNTERELLALENSYNEKIRMARLAGQNTVQMEKNFAKQKNLIIQNQVNAQLSAVAGLAGALSALAGDNKELAVASAIIDTYVGANKAFAQGGILGFVGAASIIIQGLANVKQIYAQDVGSGGGGGSIGGGATPQAPTPEAMNLDLGDATPIQEQEPVQAYVVTDDISESQDKISNIRRRASI
jgi:hypothetical protein